MSQNKHESLKNVFMNRELIPLIKEKHTDQVIIFLAAHPYISMFLACLLCHFFWLAGKTSIQEGHKETFVLLGGILVLLVFDQMLMTKRYREQKNILLLLGISFVLKFYYVICTHYTVRQHDVGVFGEEGGHCGYIEYLYQNNHLPDFDPRSLWQYCHPPLHHFLSMIWMKINVALGVDYYVAGESIQILTLFYSMVIMIIAYRIFRYFHLAGRPLYAAMFLTAFHPTYIYRAGSVNNDVLSIAFLSGAVLCTLYWYQNRTLKNILKIALCVGLGMMTKLSVGLIAPPIAIVFLVTFIKEFKKEWLSLLRQYICFGILCVPLGLWFQIRNYIKWKVPITYIHQLPDTFFLYIGDKSASSRIFDFSPSQLSSIYVQFIGQAEDGSPVGYNDYNPLIVLFKNSLFGEYIKDNTFLQTPWMNHVTAFLFWLNVAIALGSFAAMVWMLCRKKTPLNMMDRIFFISIFLTTMVSYYKTSFQYPFVCTMDFRYITFTVIQGSFFYGYLMQNLKKESGSAKKVFQICLSAAPVIFAILSSWMIIALCRATM